MTVVFGVVFRAGLFYSIYCCILYDELPDYIVSIELTHLALQHPRLKGAKLLGISVDCFRNTVNTIHFDGFSHSLRSAHQKLCLETSCILDYNSKVVGFWFSLPTIFLISCMRYGYERWAATS